MLPSNSLRIRCSEQAANHGLIAGAVATQPRAVQRQRLAGEVQPRRRSQGNGAHARTPRHAGHGDVRTKRARLGLISRARDQRPAAASTRGRRDGSQAGSATLSCISDGGDAQARTTSASAPIFHAHAWAVCGAPPGAA